MAKLRVNPNHLRPITNPTIRIEDAIGCYGEECRREFRDGEELMELHPHFHWIESELGGAQRCYAIGDNLPPDVYASAHH